MSKIEHGRAITLEHIIRRVFNNCDRCGVSGLADADHLESCPLDAATMVVSAIYATGKSNDHREFSDFLWESECTFEQDQPSKEAVDKYIDILHKIVSTYF